jgi:hypothetical protein
VKITGTRPLTIQKDKRKATIFLNAYRVVGTVYLPVGGRVSDFANWNVNDGPFIPLTDVTVYTVDSGEQLFTTAFLAVHRNHINFLTIDDEEKHTHGQDRGHGGAHGAAHPGLARRP